VSVLGEEPAAVVDAMADYLKARASGDSEPDVDWDEMYGGD
jgi:hypothetical protein